MSNKLWVMCVVSLSVAVAGCSSRDYQGEQRFPLSGNVTFDGQPVDYGAISFIPIGDAQRVSGGVIESGTYKVPEAKGANAGKYRVEIHWLKSTGKERVNHEAGGEVIIERVEVLPAKYHTKSELTAEVSGAMSVFDFALTSG